MFPCRGKGCRIEAGLTRFFQQKGKVANGRARYLLNIVCFTYRCSNHLFSEVKKKNNFVKIMIKVKMKKKKCNKKYIPRKSKLSSFPQLKNHIYLIIPITDYIESLPTEDNFLLRYRKKLKTLEKLIIKKSIV